jgi:uncharacterized OsmC-like protein
MSSAQIREAIDKVRKSLSEKPEKARIKSPTATATIEEGLRCRVTGPAGEALHTDMPTGVGGGATAPNPGWLMRAALASCNATCIAMRAAQRGIGLAKLEVTVSSEIDNRGMLGLDESVTAGLQALRVQVTISAPGKSGEELSELVRWACAHSPVGCTDASSAQLEVRVE